MKIIDNYLKDIIEYYSDKETLFYTEMSGPINQNM